MTQNTTSRISWTVESGTFKNGKVMRTNSIIILIASSLCCILSCTKASEPEKQIAEGTPMTMTISIGDVTKTTYTPEGGALKCEWEVGDQVSIITYDSYTRAVDCVDTFTAQTGGKSAVFTGTWTYTGSSPQLYVFHPALTEGSPAAWSYAPYHEYGSCSAFVTYTKNIEANISASYVNFTQKTNGGTDHIHHYDIKTGLVTKKGSAFTATLGNDSSILKFVLTLPSSWADAYINMLIFYAPGERGWWSDYSCYMFESGSWMDGTVSSNRKINLGEKVMTQWRGFQANGDGQVVVYMPFLPSRDFTGFEVGDQFEIVATAYEKSGNISATTTLTEARNFESGKIYTLKAALK